MTRKTNTTRLTKRRRWLDRAAAGGMVVPLLTGQPVQAAPTEPRDTATATPIQHVIVIVGDGRSFDHLFGTYVPKTGETVSNLLAKGIVTAKGAPGANVAAAAQFTATDDFVFAQNPTGKAAYATLPPPSTGSALKTASDVKGPPYATLAVAQKNDTNLFGSDADLLLTGATGLPPGSVDRRILHAKTLGNAPYELTPSQPYDSYAGSPVHRFYQMWQELDCGAKNVSTANPSGCLADLFPWVEVFVGPGTNGAPPPMSGGKNSHPIPYNSGEGAISMGFYNVQKGDVPYFTELANTYSLSDNYHQSIMGGKGTNSIAIGTADAIFYSSATGTPATPPSGQIENPNPYPGENNYYLNDGFGAVATGLGGAYTECAVASQPGVASITGYLTALKLKSNCAPTTFYLLNDQNPAYIGNGTLDAAVTGPFTVPPSTVPTIGDSLTTAKVSWSYYGEGWDGYLKTASTRLSHYCAVCNPFQYATSIMANTSSRTTHLLDMPNFYKAVTRNALPAVSFIRPDSLNDGSPTTSKNDLFESFTKKIITAVQAQPTLWATTAVLITYDDGGGYYDSGYVQPLDFFGDGTRVPLIVASPFATGGHVVHDYYDHASIAKFIEKNWKLQPLSTRSRDNLPNPQTAAGNPYVPTNAPAVGDLTGMFVFPGN